MIFGEVQTLQRGELPDLRRHARQLVAVEVHVVSDVSCRISAGTAPVRPHSCKSSSTTRSFSIVTHSSGPSTSSRQRPPTSSHTSRLSTDHVPRSTRSTRTSSLIRRPRKLELVVSPLQNLEVSSAYSQRRSWYTPMSSTALLLQRPHAIVIQDTNEVVGDIIARYPLEVEVRGKAPGRDKASSNVELNPSICRVRRARVGKHERPELHGKFAKAGVQIVHLVAIRTATRAHLATGLRRLRYDGCLKAEKFPRKKRTGRDGMWKFFLFGSRRRVASVFSPHPEHRWTMFKAGRGTAPARTVNRSGIVHVALQHPIARRPFSNQTRPNQTRNVAPAFGSKRVATRRSDVAGSIPARSSADRPHGPTSPATRAARPHPAPVFPSQTRATPAL